MKKILYSIFTLALLFLAPSCNDILELKSPDQLTPDKFYRDKDDAMSALAVAYSQVANPEYYYGENSFLVNEAHTDLVTDGVDFKNITGGYQFFEFSLNNTNGILASYWYKQYRGILAANRVIDGTPNVPKDKISDEDRNSIIGEARFLRAYYHFNIIMNYENIIIRDKSTSGADIDKGFAKRTEAWDWIIKEFGEASKLIKANQGTQVERATSNTSLAYQAYALLNRAYENENGEFGGSVNTQYIDDALTAINAISGVSIDANFRSLFDGTNHSSSEVLLTRPFNTDPNYTLRTVQHQWIVSKELSGFDEFRPSKDLIAIYEATKLGDNFDPRALATTIWKNDYFNTEGNFPFSFEKEVEGGDNIVVNKFDQIFKKEGAGSFYKFVSTDVSKVLNYSKSKADKVVLLEEVPAVYIPQMRYANVILMKAECQLAKGDAPGCISTINELRTARGIAATPITDAALALDYERVLEFTFENSRFYDLRRWNKLKDNATLVGRGYTAESNFFPVPKSEIDNNNAL